MGRSPITSTVSYVEVQGARVLYEHFLAASLIVEQTMPAILNAVGDLGVSEARQLAPYDTGATHDSITIVGGSAKSRSQQWGMSFAASSISEWWVEIGPETFYAPFLEYGTMYMTPRPFMIPAADIMELALAGAVVAIINAVTGDGGGLSGDSHSGTILSDPQVRNPFSSLRTYLYSTSKALGDLSVIGGRSLFGPLRAALYGMARGLGDVGSVMNQTLSTRISNRLRGRVTGRIIGFGSASLSFGRTYSAFPGGAGGHRLYQRFVGSHTSLAGVSSFGNTAVINRFFGG
jgi:HK97 gp10 family phage protein